MFIDEYDYIFGASPEGLIGDDAIVEVKCPKTMSKMHPKEAIEQKIINFCTLDENLHLQLKQNHNYYYQVQGQLHITQRSLCYFVIWTPLRILVEKIIKDDSFWTNKMKPKLENFYNSCLLPELIDPRYPRKLAIHHASKHTVEKSSSQMLFRSKLFAVS
ncbi:uncharacterized protein [Leptinotarsa decemlineata]|uniref:uncharacterized protein n=1 Tax=Leptinotarsa decemlineata TaxID=7539 RepID=UPI003D30527E